MASTRTAPATTTSRAALAVWPRWEELAGLLDQPIDAPRVQAFVNRWQLREFRKFGDGSFERYGQLPFSLMYRQGRIDRIVVDVSRMPDSSYPSGPVYTALPYGLSARDTPETVVGRLGKPTHQPERDYLHYIDKRLTLSFDRRTHQLVEAALDAK